MKALIYTQPDEIQYQDYPDPEPVSGEVIIKVLASGICGSDMHAYHGHDPRRKPGLIMGHELAGEIHHSESPLYEKGQKVTVNPLITCGRCEYCRTGRDNLCENRGMIGMTRPGAYAEYMSIPAASVIPLPDGIEPVMAAVAEPAATVMHALNFSISKMVRPVQEQSVLIMGGGAIGMLMALLLYSYGVRRIDLAETNPLRREAAARFTNARVFDPISEPVKESSYQYAVDAVGRKVTRNSCLHALRPNGVFMHIGLQEWASEIDMRKITLAELIVLGCYTYSYHELQQAVHALKSGLFGNLEWVEERPLSEGPNAFADIAGGRTSAAKIVLRP